MVDLLVCCVPTTSSSRSVNLILRNPKPQNEHVGVHEETMYCDIVAPNALQVVRSLIKKTHPMLLVIMRMIVKVETSHTKYAQSSIVPLEEDAPAASMSFPPRFGISSFLIWLFHRIVSTN